MRTITARTRDIVDHNRQPFRVTDSGHLVRDTLLTCPTAAEWEAYAANTARVDLGKVWDGNFKPIFDRLKPEDRETMFKNIDAYRAKNKTRDATAHDAHWSDGMLRQNANLNESLNEAARKRWGQTAR